MRSLITQMIDELVAELAAERERLDDAGYNACQTTIERLKAIRIEAEGKPDPRLDCTEQLAFPFVTSSDRKNGGGRGQTGGGGGAGQTGGARS